MTDNARLTLVKVREIPEELLTPVTTKNGVTKSVTQRFVAHSRVITRAVSQTPPVITKLHLRYGVSRCAPTSIDITFTHYDRPPTEHLHFRILTRAFQVNLLWRMEECADIRIFSS